MVVQRSESSRVEWSRAMVDHYFITQKEVPHLEKFCTPKSQMLSKAHHKQTVDFGG